MRFLILVVVFTVAFVAVFIAVVVSVVVAVISYELGSGVANITSDIIVNDGQQHKIVATRYCNLFKIISFPLFLQSSFVLLPLSLQ